MDITHHIKAIRPALNVMENLGFHPESCLESTGITLAQLEHNQPGITLQQELKFHRRLLELTGDPLLGLKLGEAYRVESYGMLGYAMLSAASLGDALELATTYDSLTFTHFRLDLHVDNKLARLTLSRQQVFEPALLQLYEDRELAAVIAGGEHAMGVKLPPKKVHMMHDGGRFQTAYENYFGCPVQFNCAQSSYFFDVALLETPMPLRDPETSGYCREQCQQLMNKLSRQSSFVDAVRSQLISRPGAFPGIDEVARLLNCSTRTLRRKLELESSSYQKLLNEIRYELAKEYLQTKMSIDRIAELLGYSEAANFSHAFKRWQNQSPREYRKQMTGDSAP